MRGDEEVRVDSQSAARAVQAKRMSGEKSSALECRNNFITTTHRNTRAYFSRGKPRAGYGFAGALAGVVAAAGEVAAPGVAAGFSLDAFLLSAVITSPVKSTLSLE